MPKDVSYTNGVIAVKENYLLGDKLYKICEGTYGEAARALSECGFFKNAEGEVLDFEPYLRADEEDIDSFVREYAHRAAACYLLAPRDFHNAKACVKARLSGSDERAMLAPDGLIPAEEILSCVQSGNFKTLGKIGKVCESIFARAEEEEISGAEIGIIFERAKFEYLLAECKLSIRLTKFLKQKIDMLNILSAVRSGAGLENQFIYGGTLTAEEMLKDIEREGEGKYKEFISSCLSAKREGLPPVEGERILDTFEGKFFAERRFELKAYEPVTYYVLRRRAQNKNIRIILSCLAANLSEIEIKKRLREF